MVSRHLFSSRISMYRQLIGDNRDEVRKLNFKVLMRSTQITGILMLAIIAFYSLPGKGTSLWPVYLTVLALCAVIAIFRNSSFVTEHPLMLLYFIATISMGASVYMSVIHGPTQKATIILGLFCIMPMLIIDEPWRLDLFIAFFYFLHLILAIIYKPLPIARIDGLNSLSFMALGIYIGNSSMHSRLSETDLRRRADQEKTTDVLSGIRNRRCLYERLAALEIPTSQKPVGAIMMDIDKFKDYNDRYGHAAGDECLRLFGALISCIEKECSPCLSFYRYGGDEFVALVSNCSRSRMMEMAGQIQSRASLMAIQEKHISVSLGLAYCGSHECYNYEKLIECADSQLYEAKAAGRSQIRAGDFVPETKAL